MIAVDGAFIVISSNSMMLMLLLHQGRNNAAVTEATAITGHAT